MIVDVHSHTWTYPGDFTESFRDQARRARAGVEVDLAVLRQAEEDLQRRTQRAPAATKGAAKGLGD